MLIDRIVNARVAGRDGLVDIVMADGAITGIVPGTQPTGATGPAEATELDAGGNVVLPAFVDAHVHLDKAFLLRAAEELTVIRPDLGSALAAVTTVRDGAADEAVRIGARRAVAALVRNGITAARVQVELDPAVGLGLLDLHAQLQEEFAGRIELQCVAFPQAGLDPPAMRGLLADAMAAGLPVVGGCPYLDDDPLAHLDVVFGLAERYGCPVDLHLDFSDDASTSLIGAVVERTIALGMHGRVAIGHATTLAAMDDCQRHAALELLASAGIGVIVLPATDLYLAGHASGGRRAIAPVAEVAAAGVVVAIGNNNIANPFAPFGNASLLQAAWLAGLVGRTPSPADRATLLDAITVNPARLLGLPPRSVCVGAPAELAIVDTAAPDEVISQAPTVLATIHAGALVGAPCLPTVRSR